MSNEMSETDQILAEILACYNASMETKGLRCQKCDGTCTSHGRTQNFTKSDLITQIETEAAKRQARQDAVTHNMPYEIALQFRLKQAEMSRAIHADQNSNPEPAPLPERASTFLSAYRNFIARGNSPETATKKAREECRK
jgi:hypothetical protein